ncbi:hypothetical protein, partial [Stenotrophomonas maltophilia group sp. Smal35]|uniref:hypothetical protein n=1 Tax=Stenotrophomonas maltophilia group sp. Smal35 TaxID=3377163 RepID=UPI002556530F
ADTADDGSGQIRSVCDQQRAHGQGGGRGNECYRVQRDGVRRAWPGERCGSNLRCTAQTVDRTMTACPTQTAAAHRPVPTIAARLARTWEGLWNSRLPGGVLPP